MTVTIKLTIPSSSSPNLKKVLRLAKGFQRLIASDDKATAGTLVVNEKEFFSKYRDLEQIYLLSQGWKGTQLHINGKSSDANDLRDLFVVFRCAERRSVAVVPEVFCQSQQEHGWGCKRLTAVQAGLPHDSYQMRNEFSFWFQFGSFNQDFSVWHIEKKRIYDALVRAANSSYADLCPHFSKMTLKKALKSLPDTIDIGEGSSWEVRSQDHAMGSNIGSIPVGIKPKGLDGHRDLTATPSAVSLSNATGQEAAPGTDRSIPKVSFSDIGGVDDIIDTIREMIELPLKHPNLIKYLGIKPNRGILLYGPPGCGKTLIAKAIANEISAHFISVGGPEIFTKWFGDSEAKLRQIFAEAKHLAPSVILFDEIDSIAKTRSGGDTGRIEANIVNQLLTLMDGVEDYDNVCFIASTNRLDLLDEAILRPGRFDYTLEVKHPTSEGCRRIFQIHSSGMPLDSTVDIEALACKMLGLSGAEIAFVAREGAFNCLRRNINIGEIIQLSEAEIDYTHLQVSQLDFEKALHSLRPDASSKRVE